MTESAPSSRPAAVWRPFAWGAVAAALSAGFGLGGALGLALALGGREDVERHAVGAGFVSLLIFGVGVHMLPGFARRSPRARGLTWATLLLGNGAALLRVLPALWPVAAPSAGSSYAAAGLLGLAAVALFALNALVGRRGSA